MATVLWTGNAKSVAQYTTLTVSGSVAGSEAIAVKMNNKSFTYTTTGGQTIAEIAAALALMLQQVSEPEFQEVLFSNVDATAVVDCYAQNAGVPFTITVTVTGGTVACTAATPTASAGPNDASSVANYSTVTSLPSSGDNFIKPDGTPAILYGLTALSSIDFAAVTILGDEPVGLPTINAAGGYLEYRTTSLTLGSATSLNIGDGVTAPRFCRIKINGSSSCAVKIDSGRAVAADVANPSTLLTTGGTEALVITVDTGAVGLALESGEACVVTSIKVGTVGIPGSIGASDETAAASWGSGATVTACTLYAGEVRAAASTALTQEGGTYTVLNGSNVGAITNKGGTVVMQSAGSMGACTFNGPDSVLDMSGDSRAVSSISSLSVLNGARFYDPHKRLGNIGVTLDRISAPLCEWGVTFTLTRS